MDCAHHGTHRALIAANVLKALHVIVKISQNNMLTKLFGCRSRVALEHVVGDFLFGDVRVDAIVIRDNERVRNIPGVVNVAFCLLILHELLKLTVSLSARQPSFDEL